MLRYLITDPKYYTSDPQLFKIRLKTVLQAYKVDLVCLRDTRCENYRDLGFTCKEICDIFGVNMIVHNDIKLAQEIDSYGVHINKAHYNHILDAKQSNHFVIASTHDLEEALYVQELGADAITYSPIFYTPHKGEPKGLEKLKEINDKINIHCFALGGIIEESQVQACKKVGVFGFASIRYFLKKVSHNV